MQRVGAGKDEGDTEKDKGRGYKGICRKGVQKEIKTREMQERGAGREREGEMEGDIWKGV